MEKSSDVSVEPQGLEHEGPCHGSDVLELASSFPSTKAESSKAASSHAGPDVEAALQGLGTEDIRVLSRLCSGAWSPGGSCLAAAAQHMAGRPSAVAPPTARCALLQLHIKFLRPSTPFACPTLLQPATTSRPRCRRQHATRWSAPGAGGNSSCCQAWACSPRHTSFLLL